MKFALLALSALWSFANNALNALAAYSSNHKWVSKVKPHKSCKTDGFAALLSLPFV